MTVAIEELRGRLPHLTLDELVELSKLDRVEFPQHITIVEDELVRRGVTAIRNESTIDLSERHPKRRWFAWVNPTIDDEESALRVARQGAVASWIVAGTTALFSLLAFRSEALSNTGLGIGSLVEAGIFCWFGFRVWKGSLPCAIAGLLLYAFERVYTWVTTDRFPGGIAVFLFIAFLNGSRGAVALRAYRRGLGVGGANRT